MKVEFTTHFAQACSAMQRSLRTKVPSSSGSGQYVVYVRGAEESCTCPGFKFHGRCRHVAQVRATLCQWDSEHGRAQTPQQDMEGVCPECGADTVPYRFAA